MVEDSNGGTNKANVVSKPNHLKGKNNNKKHFENFIGKSKAIQGQERSCFRNHQGQL